MKKAARGVSEIRQWPADKVERRNVADLLPSARNARIHSEKQVGQIAASIREFGWTVPVLVDESGGIIAGHGRVLAAKRLKIADIPVMVARGWSGHQRRAYLLADNKLTLDGEWDEELLRIELADLAKSDFNVELTGFNKDEIAQIIADEVSGGGGDSDGNGDAADEGDTVACSCPNCGHEFKAQMVAVKQRARRSRPPTDPDAEDLLR